MTDDSEDNGNEKAIKHVVKKSVSDVFGEEEKPVEPDYYRHGGFSNQTTYDRWKQDNPSFDYRRASETTKSYATEAAWGRPYQPKQAEYRNKRDADGKLVAINFTPEGWKAMRARVWKGVLKELDWEYIVLMPDDHVVLEQALDTVMRRSRYQVGEPGNSFRSGTLAQAPITVGDSPPAKPEPLPASSIDLKHDEWGDPGDDEVISIDGSKTGGDDE